MTELSAFAQTPEGAKDQAEKTRDICQRFGLACTEVLVGAEQLGALQKQLGGEAAAHRRTQGCRQQDLAAEVARRHKAQEDLAAEVARREELRRQFVKLRDLSYEETARRTKAPICSPK